jgi:hypothetical protein
MPTSLSPKGKLSTQSWGWEAWTMPIATAMPSGLNRETHLSIHWSRDKPIQGGPSLALSNSDVEFSEGSFESVGGSYRRKWTQSFRCIEVPNLRHGSNATQKYPKNWDVLMTAFSTSWNGGLRLSLAMDSSVTEQARRHQWKLFIDGTTIIKNHNIFTGGHLKIWHIDSNSLWNVIGIGTLPSPIVPSNWIYQIRVS